MPTITLEMLIRLGAGVVKIAVVGAGMAGLVCARRLHQGGYAVQVFEKSRGLGGRVATRRLPQTCADHGLRYLTDQGEWSQRLIQTLRQQGVVHPWRTSPINQSNINPSRVKGDRFVALDGMTSIAKWLGEGLSIARQQRVLAIDPQADRTWNLTLETETGTTIAQDFSVVVLAIPAPQAVALVAPIADLPKSFMTALEAIEFNPCVTAIAQYSCERTPEFADTKQAVSITDSPHLAWLSVESSKRPSPQPVVVVQSTATFAEEFLEVRELHPVGAQLLQAATAILGINLTNPKLLQVHRWRYAFPKHKGQVPYLASESPLPLLCCGDWCGGDRLESALHSGIKAAEQVHQWMPINPLPTVDW